jgi:hypothetical protein
MDRNSMAAWRAYRSDANNAPKAACAGDRGFETGEKFWRIPV